MVFILLFSESHRLLCNKNLIDTTISWGQFLTQQILNESWSHWYHINGTIKISWKFKLEVGEINVRS